MTPRVLFIISSDPRRSGKPAEAIRIAAGICGWQKTFVSVYLGGAAVLALGEETADLVNEENYTAYLPMLGEFNCPIFVQQKNLFLAELGQPPRKFEQLSDNELATLAAEQTYVLRF
jgi:sulfur relay (sulfurtransferase) DsrF/TusC family protein